MTLQMVMSSSTPIADGAPLPVTRISAPIWSATSTGPSNTPAARREILDAAGELLRALPHRCGSPSCCNCTNPALRT